MHAAQLKPNTSHSMKVIATDPTGGLHSGVQPSVPLRIRADVRLSRPASGRPVLRHREKKRTAALSAAALKVKPMTVRAGGRAGRTNGRMTNADKAHTFHLRETKFRGI